MPKNTRGRGRKQCLLSYFFFLLNSAFYLSPATEAVNVAGVATQITIGPHFTSVERQRKVMGIEKQWWVALFP